MPLEHPIQVPLEASADVHPSAHVPLEISADVELLPQSIVELSTDGEQQTREMTLEISTDTSKHFDMPPAERTRPPEPSTATSKQNDDLSLVETTLPKEPDDLPVVEGTHSREPSTDTSKHFGGVPIIVENVKESNSVSQSSQRRPNVLKIRVRQSSSKADDGNNRNQRQTPGRGNENEVGPCSSVSVDAPARSTRETPKVNIDEANSFHNHDSRMTTSIASANKRVSLHDETSKDLQCTADSKNEDGGSSQAKIPSEVKEAKEKRKKEKKEKKRKREDKADKKDDPEYMERKRLKKEKKRLEKERAKMESKGVVAATSEPRVVVKPVVAPIPGRSIVPPVSRETNKVQQQSVAPKIRIKIKGFGLGSSTPSEK